MRYLGLRLFALFTIALSPVALSQVAFADSSHWYKVEAFSLMTLSGQPDNSTARELLPVEAIIVTDADKFILALKPVELLQGQDVALKDNGQQFYHGHIVNVPGSWARISVNGELVHGVIKHQGRYKTVSNYNEPYAPLDIFGLQKSAADRSTYQYTFLGDTDSPLLDAESFNRILTLGVVVDHYYDERYDGDGVAHALSVVSATDAILRENLQMALKVEAVITTLDEEFSSAEGASVEQLSRFRTFRQSVPELSPDIGLVHLFSQSPRFGTIVGRAYIKTVCNVDGFDVGISLGYWQSAQLMAHELGHNLGALHDTIDGCESGSRRIMYPDINSSREFSSCSLDRINAVLESRECFIDKVQLAINARRFERTLILQVSNLDEGRPANDIEVSISRTDNLLSELPENCIVEGAEIKCEIPQLSEGETLDLLFPVDGNPTGELIATVTPVQGYEVDLSDNTSALDFADFPEQSTEGLCIDTDGDGFGWNGTQSCRTRVPVIDDAEVKPQFINAQTGIPVNLVAAYWRPEDITGQVIECVSHYWSSEDNFYRADDSIIRRYRHEASDEETTAGTVQVATFVATSEGDPPGTDVVDETWSVDNGRYVGPLPVERSRYIQIVDEADSRFNATRSWTSDLSFDLCRSFPEPSGYFVPSGTIDRPVAGVCVDTPPRNDGFGWNGLETCQVDPDLDATGSQSVIVNEVAGEVIIDGYLDEPFWESASNSDTGGSPLNTPVTMFGLDAERKGSWLIAHQQENLFLAVIAPDSTPNNDSDKLWEDDSIELFFDGGFQRNSRYDGDDTQVILRDNGERTGIVERPVVIDFARRYDAEEQVYIYEIRFQKTSLSLGTGEFGLEVQINDDQDGGLRDSKSGWAAEEGKDVQWYDLTVVGHACLEGGGAIDNCLLSNQLECMDTEPLGDGWGWDGVKSCRVSCVDTDPVGDGWGWDGMQSCRVDDTPAECIDVPPLGDGFGWDGSESCRLEVTTVQCIDTEPLGDGWGWNGTESCRVGCEDTEPVGDGWGWDGTQSCRVGSVVPGDCIDTDPLGDGWGWNGIESCRI